MCIKSEGRAIFWNIQPVIKVIGPFCLHQNIVPKSCLVLPWGFIYTYEIKQSYKMMRQMGSFWNWYKMMGIIKAIKCFQNLYKVVVCPCPGAFFKDDLGLTLTIFMTESNLFLMLLYGWQLIEHWVLLYFQVRSNSEYLQHSGERYRTNGPLVYSMYRAGEVSVYRACYPTLLTWRGRYN